MGSCTELFESCLLLWSTCILSSVHMALKWSWTGYGQLFISLFYMWVISYYNNYRYLSYNNLRQYSIVQHKLYTGAFACEKCENVTSGWVVLSPYLFDIKNEKKIITVYGAILMYTLNDLTVWVLVTVHVFSWKPGNWVVNSMTSISVGLGLRLILLFVVSLHPGIKMVQYSQPISSLEVHPAVECHPIQGGKRGGGGGGGG